MKNQKGITLIALIVTIIILLILSGVTIGILVNQGIIGNAERAKDVTQIAQDKEIISLSAMAAKMKEENRKLTLNNLNEELRKYAGEAYNGVDNIVIRIENRYYEMDLDENIFEVETTGLKKLVLQCIDSAGNILEEQNYILLKNEYSIEPLKIEDYECAAEIIEGTITQDKTVKQLYYKIFDDDTELVFTGLNSSGAVTTNESEISSYMVGNNSNASGNGLLEKTIKGVVKIPETYNGYSVQKIASYAFSYCNNIIKIDTGDNVQSVVYYGFIGCSNLLEFTIGKSITKIESHSFWGCDSLGKITFKNSLMQYLDDFGLPGTSWSQIEIDNENTAYKVEDNILYSADGKTIILCPKGKKGEIIIPETVEKIAYGAFFGCSNITKVTIHDSIKTIGGLAFYGSGIQEIVIGKNVESFGARVFVGCSKLESVTFRNNNIEAMSELFSGCSSWSEIKVSDDNLAYKVEENILYSATGKGLVRCPPKKEKEEIIIGETVTHISGCAFEECKNIKSIVISDNVTSVGYRAFNGTNIEQITIGESVVSYGYSSFNSSTLNTVIIKSPTIASQLTSQGACSNLINKATTIYIKEGISTIGSYVTTNFTEAETDKEGYTKYVKI